MESNELYILISADVSNSNWSSSSRTAPKRQFFSSRVVLTSRLLRACRHAWVVRLLWRMHTLTRPTMQRCKSQRPRTMQIRGRSGQRRGWNYFDRSMEFKAFGQTTSRNQFDQSTKFNLSGQRFSLLVFVVFCNAMKEWLRTSFKDPWDINTQEYYDKEEQDEEEQFLEDDDFPVLKGTKGEILLHGDLEVCMCLLRWYLIWVFLSRVNLLQMGGR